MPAHSVEPSRSVGGGRSRPPESLKMGETRMLLTTIINVAVSMSSIRLRGIVTMSIVTPRSSSLPWRILREELPHDFVLQANPIVTAPPYCYAYRVPNRCSKAALLAKEVA